MNTYLKEIYKQIENPLNDDNKIKKIIENCFENYYNLLTTYNSSGKLNIDERKVEEEIIKNHDEFFIFCFNTIRKKILELSDEDLEKLSKKGEVFRNICLIKDELKYFPNINSIDGFDKIASEKLIEFSSYFYPEREWVHMHSYNLLLDGSNINNVEHRLYINLNLTEVEKFVKLFIELCLKEKVPFYLKFCYDWIRDEQVVIYTDDEHINKYINLIRNIKQTSNIVFLEPPMLTGKIDDVIGYGSEPLEKQSSFNIKRSDLLSSHVKNIVLDYIFDNLNKQIEYDNNQYTLLQIIFKESNLDKVEIIKQLKTNLSFELEMIIQKILNILSNDMDLINLVRNNLIDIFDMNGMDKKICFDKIRLQNKKFVNQDNEKTMVIEVK